MTAADNKEVQLFNPHKDDPARPGNALHIKTYAGTHGYPILDIAIARDNSKFVSVGGDKSFFLHDVTSARVIRRTQAHTQRINAVALNEDSSVCITASYDATVNLFDLKSSNRDPIQTLSAFTDSVTSVIHVDSKIIASAVDGTVRTFDMRNGCMHVDIVGNPITHVRLSNDARCVLCSCIGGTVHLIDLHTGAQLNEYSGHKHDSYKLEACISGDDCRIVTGSEDGFIYHYDLITGKLVRKNKAHKKGVSSLCWHPSKSLFLSASYDGTVKCWESKYP
jgi:mitogen-activated protein kinase organizer 1